MTLPAPAAPPLRLRLGTRGSDLALIQADIVTALLTARYPGLQVERRIYTTKPERHPETPVSVLGDKGLFVYEIEEALRRGDVDLAVHSLKDVPIADAAGLTIAAIPARADPRDVLVSGNGAALVELTHGARVGTSSLRRSGQLRAARPDLLPVPIRGNVDTRLRKLVAGEVDALILAEAGLDRLDLGHRITEYLDIHRFVPAAGQGALAVQCRLGSPEAALIRAIDDPAARAEITAERTFAAALGADCHTPIGVCGRLGPRGLWLIGAVSAPDGSRFVSVSDVFAPGDPTAAGEELARQAIVAGAAPLLGVG